jgi:hypothetical protein
MTNIFGQCWSPWPSAGLDGKPNLVSGHRVIAVEMFSVCLTMKGENPLHPNYGVAPELFGPLSGKSAQYFVYKLQEELTRALKGYVTFLEVLMEEYLDFHNALKVRITYRPVGYSDYHTLAFPFYTYNGPDFTIGADNFMAQVVLDDAPLFPKLR